MHCVLVLPLVAVAALPSAASWRGTFKVDGMIHEPSGYHPYITTVSFRLREAERVTIPGGFRAPLISEGSIYDVQTKVYRSGGVLLCSGTGTETLTGRTLGYLETKAGRTVYHLLIPRAFGAFACGRNHVVDVDRGVIIGMGDPEAADIETADSVIRLLEHGDALMKGSFRSTKTRGSVDYEYDVSWSLVREGPLSRTQRGGGSFGAGCGGSLRGARESVLSTGR